MSSTEHVEAPEKFVFYAYTPSLPAAVIFIVLFALSAGWHVKQLLKHRTWYFIPFVVGFEAIGYVGRVLSWKESPDFTKNPYIIQSLLLLLGPALFAASIYMVLGRLIVRLDAQALSPVRVKWLTKIFVTGDVLSFFVQGGGGAMMATAKSRDDTRMGENIILAGLGVQILFFGVFIVVTCVFHRRLIARPTETSLSLRTPWKGLLWVLYGSSVLIMIRSVFRIIEYGMGSEGELLQKEAYLYVFDAVPMFVIVVALNWFHPSRVLSSDGDKIPLTSVTSREVVEGNRGSYGYQNGSSQGYDQEYSSVKPTSPGRMGV
ncbi:related to RTM1 protein [Cephalotrichum gorgonifer]|uniref:Related to RTM1 protein n=1 Tax=Cephalotrichum gorgonifer TaxID=2041049 RepID=A0AAE8SQU5_9PEZI|nr:related to RTM1 protein [Cephalotrichum gorgonifer]